MLRGVITWESIARPSSPSAKTPWVKHRAATHRAPPRHQKNSSAASATSNTADSCLSSTEENAVRVILIASGLSHQLGLRVEPFTLLEEIER